MAEMFFKSFFDHPRDSNMSGLTFRKEGSQESLFGMARKIRVLSLPFAYGLKSGRPMSIIGFN